MIFDLSTSSGRTYGKEEDDKAVLAAAAEGRQHEEDRLADQGCKGIMIGY